MSQFREPPTDPLEDTSPSLVMRPVSEAPIAPTVAPQEPGTGRSRLGGLSLIVGALFVLGTIIILLLPDNDPLPTFPTDLPDSESVVSLPTEDVEEPTPTEAVVESIPATDVPLLQMDAGSVPTVSAERLSNLLQAPLPNREEAGTLPDALLDPFTIIPQRPRSDFIEYEVTQGDTIDGIARRFNLQPESIAWCNDRRVIYVIRPGDRLRIPPTDGACYQVLGTRNQTIADISAEYEIEDPYAVLDWPTNNLFGLGPDDTPLGGINLFLPGGQGPLITWNPGSERTENDDGSVTVAFAPGQRGSCGPQTMSGGTFWGNPLPNGTWVRGYFAGHTGIDLAAAPGTPIYAANGGPVLFSGFSQWGYGNTVVLGHGPFSTLYAHMTSTAVNCGQVVGTGQVVGYVGSTGNSSGPHLHFEIRYNDTPQDPTLTAGIGW